VVLAHSKGFEIRRKLVSSLQTVPPLKRWAGYVAQDFYSLSPNSTYMV
jgi:hypothetical protein